MSWPLYIILIFTVLCRITVIAAPVLQLHGAEYSWQSPDSTTEDAETEKGKYDFKDETSTIQETFLTSDRKQEPVSFFSDNRIIWHPNQPPTPPPNDVI